MNVPAEIRILRVLADNDKGYGVTNAVAFLKRQLPDLNLEAITVALFELKRLNKLEIIKSGVGIDITVKQDAYQYLKIVEEVEDMIKSGTHGDFSWRLKANAASYIAGLISGLAMMWLKIRHFS